MEHGKKPRNPMLLFFGLTAFITLAAYINIVPPDSLAAVGGFFALLSVTSYLLSLYVFRKARHAVIITVGCVLYFMLRYIGLRQIFFGVLLGACIIAVEFLWKETG